MNTGPLTIDRCGWNCPISPFRRRAVPGNGKGHSAVAERARHVLSHARFGALVYAAAEAPSADVLVARRPTRRRHVAGRVERLSRARRPCWSTFARVLMLVDVTPGVNQEKARASPSSSTGRKTSRAPTRSSIARRVQPDAVEQSLRRGILHNAEEHDDGRWGWRYDLPAGAAGRPTARHPGSTTCGTRSRTTRSRSSSCVVTLAGRRRRGRGGAAAAPSGREGRGGRRCRPQDPGRQADPARGVPRVSARRFL